MNTTASSSLKKVQYVEVGSRCRFLWLQSIPGRDPIDDECTVGRRVQGRTTHRYWCSFCILVATVELDGESEG